MSRFSFVAYDTSGQLQRGVVVADDSDAARERLAENELVLLDLKRRRLNGDARIRVRRSLSPRQTAELARNLANTQAAGVPIFRAVSMLAAANRNTVTGDVFEGIGRDLANGLALSEAFRNQQDRVGPLICAIVAAGEATGQLEDALTRLTQTLDMQVEARRKTRLALTYPLFTAAVTATVFLVISLYVLPIFEQLYGDFDVDLPQMTQLLLGFSRLFPAAGLWLPALAVAAAAYWWMMRSQQVRLIRDRLVLHIPLVGRLVRASNTGQIMSALSCTLHSGVPLLTALSIGADVSRNHEFVTALHRVRDKVRDGWRINAALAEETVFPPMLAAAVGVGEETATLVPMLERYAEVLAKESDTTVNSLISILQPVALVVVGLVAGLFMVAMYLPLFNLVSAL